MTVTYEHAGDQLSAVPPLAAGDVERFKQRLLDHVTHTVGKNLVTMTDRDWYRALAFTVRDLITEGWIDSFRQAYREDGKRVYYLSLEFLIGRSLVKNLLNAGFFETCTDVLSQLGLDLDRIAEQEPEAALGNGGLGRLAACLLDSLATLGIPAYGYGIRYDYGMFSQYIEDGRQVEMPDNWLHFGNAWEFSRPEVHYPIKFFGTVAQFRDDGGVLRHQWINAEEVFASAYDTPVAGFRDGTVNTLRLWRSRSSQDFDLLRFNRGDYAEAVRGQSESESLSRILYPDDSTFMGKMLRLKQEYFFVSASLQDILRRFLSQHDRLEQLPDKVAIQLNDTHPAIAIPEMMRLLMDVHGLGWERAWRITVEVFSYTNHTLLPEALETWPVHLFENMLPRHLQIILEINHRFLQDVRRRFPGDEALVRNVSLLSEDGERRVRMANLAFVGSHKVNGVAQLHTDLMKSSVFANLHRVLPERICNKTNGITPRRWLNQANRPLAALITDTIGDRWAVDLAELRRLEAHIDDPELQGRFTAVKRRAKERLARLARERVGVDLDIDSMFDVQVKRIHEYKRQLLNVLHVITRYNRLRADPRADAVPRTVIFAGKSAPSYHMAKLVIRLINDIADVVNHDPAVAGRLKVVFIPNYNVSSAELIIPSANLSEQISTAGMEASGTGNMKLALNGALTIGTRDGANIEICEEVGEENIFFFGLSADQVEALRSSGRYDPWLYYERNAELRHVLDMIGRGFFSPSDPGRYMPIFDSLTGQGDHYMLLADYEAYVACQDKVDLLYHDPVVWTRKALLNIARMGKFSTDRTVLDYAQEIWKVRPPVPAAAASDVVVPMH